MAAIHMVLTAGRAIIAGLAVALVGPSPAGAEQAVVTATIFPGGQGSISTQTVSAAALSNCPPYTGSAPFILNPGATPFQPVLGSSWSLDTIVSCGLRVPASSLTDVSVRSNLHGFEATLSPGDLSDATRYQDLSAPSALPVISLDPGPSQVSYARPLRSAGDANAVDHVVGTGPVTIAVYENALPLVVRVSRRRLSVSARSAREQLTATVADAGGHPVSAAALSWRWSFGDGAVSPAPAPEHAFAAGQWFVTVIVTDRAAGTGGTTTVPVVVDSRSLPAVQDRSGAGANRNAPSLAGAVHNARPNAGPPASAHPGTTTSASAPHAGTTPSLAAPAPVPSPRVTAGASHRRRTHRLARPPIVPPPPAHGRLVRGLLVAAVVPVAPEASPLVHPVTPSSVAPITVRAATHITTVGGWLAGAGVAALLALGAARELRGRRRWRRIHARA